MARPPIVKVTEPLKPWIPAERSHQSSSQLGERYCLLYLEWAFQQLKVSISAAELQALAELVVEAMTQPSRCFHSLEHCFDVAQAGDSLEVLAALFHDVVYVQIDGGISPRFEAILAPFIKTVRERLVVSENPANLSDRCFALVMAIFDIQPGHHLALEQNEFLSALVAAKQLKPFLNWAQLAKVIACIEATIPFRPPTSAGLQPSDVLYHKLSTVNARFKLGLSEAELVATVQRAVRVANRDVENFSDLQAADFLSNTWNLLPESNPSLRDVESYTVQEYRHALEKTTSFMYYLNAPLVFRQFREDPSTDEYCQLLQRANKNLVVARLYLNTKLLAIAILEALSQRSEITIPLERLGQVSFSEIAGRVMRQQSLLATGEPYQPRNSIEQEVWDLLEMGRAQESSFDIKNSPLAAFLLKHLGIDQVVVLVDRAKAFFQGQTTSEAFLAECDDWIIELVQAVLSRATQAKENSQ
ncbi:MAG: hypothetical protein F6K04_24865 [Leptolyngbya sp. SIO4C5]|nr:hypothetical protein [Leptolyngbya sp. SIO4C5]